MQKYPKTDQSQNVALVGNDIRTISEGQCHQSCMCGSRKFRQMGPGNEWYDVAYTYTFIKVSKGAKIRNWYNQVLHLTQDTNGKVTNSQLDTTSESQEVSPFPADDHKTHINRRTQRHSKHKTEQKLKRSTKAMNYEQMETQMNIIFELQLKQTIWI